MIRKFGWIPDKRDKRDLVFRSRLRRLPREVDLRPFMPPMYNQESIGSCTAQATEAVMEYLRHRNKLKDFTGSRLFIYYNTRLREGNQDWDAGGTLRNSIKSVNSDGDCPETEWPYITDKFAQRPPPNCYEKAQFSKALQYQRIVSTYDMLSCLADGYPFVFGIAVYPNFPQESDTGIIPMPEGESGGIGHAMAAAGYFYQNNEVMVRTRNSWDIFWGEGGYGAIPLRYLGNRKLAGDFWSIRLIS